MTGELKVRDIVVNEDGSATYSFDLDDKAAAMAQEEGLKVLLYCGLTKVALQDVYDWILSQVPDVRPMDDEEKQRAKERNEVNNIP